MKVEDCADYIRNKTHTKSSQQEDVRAKSIAWFKRTAGLDLDEFSEININVEIVGVFITQVPKYVS